MGRCPYHDINVNGSTKACDYSKNLKPRVWQRSAYKRPYHVTIKYCGECPKFDGSHKAPDSKRRSGRLRFLDVSKA